MMARVSKALGSSDDSFVLCSLERPGGFAWANCLLSLGKGLARAKNNCGLSDQRSMSYSLERPECSLVRTAFCLWR
ncbi:hypothetical protein AAC387_Pa08g0927 [Persea americana]